jgi:hypothetical protein
MAASRADNAPSVRFELDDYIPHLQEQQDIERSEKGRAALATYEFGTTLVERRRGRWRSTFYCAGTYVGSWVCSSMTEPYAVTRPAPSITRTVTRAL